MLGPFIQCSVLLHVHALLRLQLQQLIDLQVCGGVMRQFVKREEAQALFQLLMPRAVLSLFWDISPDVHLVDVAIDSVV